MGSNWHRLLTLRRLAFIKVRRRGSDISYRLFVSIYQPPGPQGGGEEVQRAA